MKLKFRADTKDVVIFAIFAGALFLLICLAVANIGSFIKDNTFSGLNILPAFTEYFLVTITLFIVCLFAMFMSVQSVFFEREEGIGIEIGAKKEKNYARWAKDKEIKKGLDVVEVDPLAPKANAGGVPLIMTPKRVWVDNGGYHNLVIGSTGAGKTQTTVLPMVNLLAKHDESMIITDPKGEIYEQTSNYLRSLDYNIVLLNFRDPQQGNSWNPMYLPYSLYKENKIDKSIELLEDLAANILKDPQAKGQDPFWENTSADYFAGLSCALFEDGTPDQINLNSINLMTTVGEEKLANTTYIKEYFSFKDPASTAYVKASSTLMAPNETKGSILSVFKQRVQLFASRKNLSEMLAHNDFDMRDIGKKKTAVFIVIQDEKTTYHTLVTIFLKQCYETLISVAQECGGKLPHRTNFILDEFANMPPLKDVTTMVTAARSRNIRFTFIIQNFSQLYDVYGKEQGETIKGNVGNIIYLISTELSALEEISKMCGEVKSKEKEKTSSTPLVTVSDLQRMDMWQTIILRLRTMPFKTKLTPNFQMDWGHHFPKAEYPQREEMPVDIFDIKSLVEKKREEKINKLIGGGDSSSSDGGNKIPPTPFGKGTPDSPFSSRPLPSSTPNPFSSSTAPKSDGGLNLDNLVKRIDQKIAEMEKEEAMNAQAPKPVPTPSMVPNTPITEPISQPNTGIASTPVRPTVPNTPSVPTRPVMPNIPSTPVSPSAPNVGVSNTPTPQAPVAPNKQSFVPEQKKDVVSDDQFFDDFFGDD